MINSEKSIYLQETEIKPNRYATVVFYFLVFGMLFCWLLNEVGIFRVGKLEMRIGSAIPLFFILLLVLILNLKKEVLGNPKTKYFVFGVAALFTLFISTLLNFHTTIMLLFPIFLAMLYRSTKLGVASLVCSIFCTVLAPILGYVLHVWDIPLLEELILIGAGGVATVENPDSTITLISILKIILYLVLPRLLMVGSCGLLMFYVIRLGNKHVQNQILLDRLHRRDMLTSLYNRNYFDSISDTVQEGSVGFIFFDVNNLKAANDAYGHEYGDLLLQRCAKSLADVCDDNTEGFRLGGDEFLLLIENANEAAVSEKLAEWQKALANINKENESMYNGLVCSMAEGHTVGKFSEMKQLLHQADVLMYQNKATMKTNEK